MKMSNLVTIENEKSKALVETAGRYLASLGCNLQEKHRTQFLEICKHFNLNPFAREIYAIPYGNNFNIIVGYEVYIKRAEMSGQLAGWKAWSEGEGAELKGVVEIYRKDWREPFRHEVYFSEYNQNNSMWKSKPRTMIQKVAIAQGFRMCFPCELGGLPYTSDEIPLQEVSSSIQDVKPVTTNKDDARSIAIDFKSKLNDLGLSDIEIKSFCKKFDISSKDTDRLKDLLADDDLLKDMLDKFFQDSESVEVVDG